MFSPGSLDKSSASSSEASPGRGKFPIGMNPVGDENQQNIRIQLAVHRYNNNSPGNTFARSVSERNGPHSPFKHALFKSTQKYKSFESEKEEAQSNGLKKSFIQYDGVGNFPVVHLRKNTVISKPIKRNSTNEFKVQLPELPLNRFLSQSPDVCLDTKTSTRSVLDVLQDLSRKRIHTKDDPEVNKRKCKGLGGDAPLDIEAPYKPLFVPKSKRNSVTLRDSTTQTQEFPPTETQQSKRKEIVTNDKDDPKAALRRKLARQNNEIFASLSSSTLSYPIKRSSEKMSQVKDHLKEDEPSKKRTKYFSEVNGDKVMQNGGKLTNLNGTKTAWNSADSSKLEKKAKEGTKVSPGKDRLTNIFLEIQNINPKVEVLKNRGENEKEDSFSPKPTGLGGEKLSNVKETESKITETETVKTPTETAITNISVVTTVASDKKSEMSKDTGDSNKDVESSTTTTTISAAGFSLPTTTTLNFGITPSSKISVASTVSSSVTQMPIISTGITQKTNTATGAPYVSGFVSPIQNSVKAETTKSDSTLSTPKQQTFKIPTSGSLNESTADAAQKPSVSSPPVFKFGIQSPAQLEVAKDSDKINILETKSHVGLGLTSTATTGSSTLGGFTSAIAKSTTSAAPTFTFCTVTTNTAAASELSTSLFTFSNTKSGQVDKPAFQFSFNPSNASKTAIFVAKPEEKAHNETNKPEAPVSTTTSTSIATTFSSASTTSLCQNEQGNQPAPTFKFGEKTEPPKPATTETTGIFGQKPGIFTFGQKPADAPSISQGAVSQSGLFQTTTTTTTTAISQPTAPQSSLFQTSTSISQPAAPQPSLFQTNTSVSQPTTTQPSLFQTSTSVSPVTTEASLFQTSTSISQPSTTQPSLFQTSTSLSQPGVAQSSLFQQTITSTAASQTNVFQPSVFTFGQKINTTKGGTSLFGQGSTTTTTQSNMFQPNQSQPSNSVLNSASAIGVTSQANPLTKAPTFMQSGTGSGLNNNNNTTFGQNKPNVPTAFGQQTSTGFSTGGNIFGSSSTQNTTSFPQPQQTPFGSQAFGDNTNKQQQDSGFFMQPPATQPSAFGQSAFGSTTFGQAPTTEGNIFGQKQQMTGFDQSRSQPFGQTPAQPTFASAQSPFTFGAPSSSTGMNSQSTAPSVFTFGGAKATTAPTSAFGFNAAAPSPASSLSTPSSSSTPFGFNNPSSGSPFKFGAASSNGGAGSAPFAFNATPSTSEVPKSAGYNFGAAPATPSSNPGYNFGASSQTPSSVFSFGSNSASSSTSKFTFGGSPATAGGMFTPGVTPSQSTQVPVQGMFSIGSGSSQPRSRSSGVRARRRT